ncbi:hypothetical protein YDYSG_61450 [Paenibacillus tyrfis]|nr:hypothetical protein YDYSG_61450 [Paenibacillus tyrfis]
MVDISRRKYMVLFANHSIFETAKKNPVFIEKVDRYFDDRGKQLVATHICKLITFGDRKIT